MTTNKAYLSLGSNINPKNNLRSAISKLNDHGKVLEVSSVWETKPLGNLNQPNYLNVIILFNTSLEAKTLKFNCIKPIEDSLGRKRSTLDPYCPRTIDIDIMLFNNDIITIGHKRIPNNEIFERDFIAICLAEIAPDYVHPETHQTISEIASTFNITSHITTHNDIITLK